MVSKLQLLDPSDEVDDTFLETVADLTADPERDAVTAEIFSQIKQAFQDDPTALHVLSGMALGKAPSQIQDEGNMDARRYASTQRRIRRTLARIFPDTGEMQ